MGRPRRINVPGGICHITQQAHSKSYDFAQDQVKQKYLELAYNIAKKVGVEVISFSLQDSHPHWVIKMPTREDYTISQFMHALNTRFGKWFNKAFHRKGSFWAGRFSCTWVEAHSANFFQLTRYVDRNPIERQNNQVEPENYPWGSFRDLFNTAATFPVTFLDYLFKAHPEKTEQEAWNWYKDLVKSDKSSLEHLSGLKGLFFGSLKFREKGTETYKLSLHNSQVRGTSWKKIVQDFSKLFLPESKLQITST